MKFRSPQTLAALAASLSFLLLATPSVSAGTLLFEDFDGAAVSLDGKTPTTADPDLAGITWDSTSGFLRNGEINIGDRKGVLDIGSYIDDRKGDADAIFTVSATVDPLAGGSNWVAVGFYGSTYQLGESGVQGAAAVTLFRDGNEEADGYTAVDGAGIVRDNFATGLSGAQTYGVTLDLTGWDGSTNFGTVTFNIGGTSSGSYALTDDVNFQAVGFGTPGSGDGLISDFQLVQVPEPGTLWLLGLGLSSLLWFRRKRNPAA